MKAESSSGLHQTVAAEDQLANGEAGGEEDAAHLSCDGGARHGCEAARFDQVTKELGTVGGVAAPEDSSLVERKRKTRHSNNPPVEQHVGLIMDKKAHAPQLERLESLSESEGSMTSSGGGTPQSLPAFHHPSHSLLKASSFSFRACFLYLSFVMRAMSTVR